MVAECFTKPVMLIIGLRGGPCLGDPRDAGFIGDYCGPLEAIAAYRELGGGPIDASRLRLTLGSSK